MSYHDELRDKAEAAARQGAVVLRRHFKALTGGGESSLEVEAKGRYDYVSKADRESEAAILAEIRRSFPDHAILAEESGRSRGGGDYQWLVDPLDGTTNFLQGLPVFCISVACRRGGEVVAGVVLDPIADQLFRAAEGSGAELNGRPVEASSRDGLEGSFLATGYPWRARAALDQYLGAFREVFLEARSVRRCGAAALDLAYTAAGVYDGFFEFRLSPWDIAAGILLVREAGGRVSDLDGAAGFPQGGNVIAGGARVHAHLLAAVQRHADEAALDRLVPRGAETTTGAAHGDVGPLDEPAWAAVPGAGADEGAP